MNDLEPLPQSKQQSSVQNDLINRWVTRQLDRLQPPRLGTGWRVRAQGGTVHQCMQAVAVKKYGAFFAPTEEYLFAKRAADHLNMTQSAFLRLCVAQFLLGHGYATREDIPVMAEHVR
jgi:hypothetical protein